MTGAPFTTAQSVDMRLGGPENDHETALLW